MSERLIPAYLAGPDVFFPNAKALGAAKVQLAAKYGFEGLFPLDAELDLAGMDGPEAARAIFEANLDLMERAQIVIANISPFRGPGLDGGTAWELGWCHAKGKPAFAYSVSDATYVDRVLALFGGSRDTEQDADGLTIEGFGMADNLMIICGLAGGAPVLRAADPAASREEADMQAFEHCLKAAQKACA